MHDWALKNEWFSYSSTSTCSPLDWKWLCLLPWRQGFVYQVSDPGLKALCICFYIQLTLLRLMPITYQFNAIAGSTIFLANNGIRQDTLIIIPMNDLGQLLSSSLITISLSKNIELYPKMTQHISSYEPQGSFFPPPAISRRECGSFKLSWNLWICLSPSKWLTVFVLKFLSFSQGYRMVKWSGTQFFEIRKPGCSFIEKKKKTIPVFDWKINLLLSVNLWSPLAQ